MNSHDNDPEPGSRPVDRRHALRLGGGLAGVAALAGLARPRPASANRPAAMGAVEMDRVEMDMACDGRTFRLNRLNQSDPNALPMTGDTFIVFGSLYPAGTIERGLQGPDQAGAFGRWVCRGTMRGA